MSQRLSNLLWVDLNGFLWNDSTVLINAKEIHTILKWNDVEFLAHGCLCLVNHISLFDQQEVFDNLQSSFNSLDLYSQVLEFVDLTWVDVGVHAVDPNVAWSEDFGLGRHFDDLWLNQLFQIDVIVLSEDKTDFSIYLRDQFYKLWFSFVFFEDLIIFGIFFSFHWEDFDGQNGQVVLTNDDFSSILGNMLFGFVDLQSGNVDNVYYDDLVVGAEVFEEFSDDFGLVIWIRLSLHAVYKKLEIL